MLLHLLRTAPEDSGSGNRRPRVACIVTAASGDHRGPHRLR